ncbi:MAG: metalloregulator ArsR/SmtB family transcription factor [Pseudomonadota bacterium]
MKDALTESLSIEEAAQAFAALGSEQRLGVLRLLVRAGPDGLSTGDLAERSGIPNSTLTHHLRFLVHAGLVEQEKRGRTIVCSSVAYDMAEALSNYILTNCCADAADTGDHDHG